MISRIVRCAAHSPLHALVFAPLLALAVLGASGTPSFAAQQTDEAERNATVTESASEDPNAPGSPRFLGSAIEWNLGDAESATVTISHPDGRVTRHEFGPGEVPRIELGAAGQEGLYAWEIVGAPPAARQGPDGGGFVRGGIARVGAEGVAQAGNHRLAERRSPAESAGAEGDFRNDGAGMFDGGLCTGAICRRHRSMLEGTLWLTHNATSASIWFWDQHVGPGVPSSANIWQIGGTEDAFFVLRGSSTWGGPRAGRSFFLTTAGTLLQGRVGINSNTPAKDLHINTSGSPTIRLERNASGGGTARIWDIGASATNFFIGNASRFPFQIVPSAPTGTLFLAASGNVGVGTDAPGAKLHVYGANGSTSETIEEASASSALRTLLNLRNRGGTRTLFDDTTIAQSWSVGTQNSGFVIDELAHAGVEFQIDNSGNTTIAGEVVVGQHVFVGRDLDVGRDARVAGNLTVFGQLIQPSSRSLKRDFAPVDAQAVLDLVVALPVSTWSYNSDVSVRHMGPVAEDFRASFGLGGTDKGIATVDSDGVALAAIQGLHQKLQALENENQALRQRLETMDRALAGLLAERESPRPKAPL